ncbi:MAG: AMP phosphorylase [Nanoarchaeota archaeon]
MRLKVKNLALGAGRPVAFLHPEAAKKLNVHVGDRIELLFKGTKIIAVVDIMKKFLYPNYLSLSDEIIDYLNVKPGEFIDVSLAKEADSLDIIAKKMNGGYLNRKEILTIITDIVNNALTEAEIAYFILAVYEKKMSIKEIVYLTEAMCSTGTILKWKKGEIIADKHSIGGIPGNRTTPLVVSICAAAGIKIPKTSSRSITSAAGTADVMEAITNVDFSASTLKKIVERAGACLAWGGSIGLAPADDRLIRIERIIDIDPESQLIASILSKKIAVGSKYVLIDIPYGENAKVTNKEAKKLGRKFIAVGKSFGLKVRIVLTDGSQPIGNGVGPILEIMDILKVLKRDNSPRDLEEKSLFLAANLLEMVGKAPKGKGISLAKEILDSGKALKKFEQIISAQGKKNNFLKLARFKHDIIATNSGTVKTLHNKAINHIGRLLGCPIDKGAGLYLFKHKGDSFEKGDVLITLYSESKIKLKEAIHYFNSSKPIH